MLDAICTSQECKDIIYKELFQGEEWILGDKGIIPNHQRFDGPSKRVPEKYHKELRGSRFYSHRVKDKEGRAVKERKRENL